MLDTTFRIFVGVRTAVENLVLDLTREGTPAEVAQTTASGLAGPSVVLARVWLADESQSLHLQGSAGSPTGGGSYNRLDGQFAHISRGSGKIGLIAESRSPFVVRGIRGDEDWLVNPGWIARQGVRSFVGYPLIASDHIFGVMAVFYRMPPTDDHLEALRFLADYMAACIAERRERAALQAELIPAEKASPSQATTILEDASSIVDPVLTPIVTRADLRAYEKQTIEAALARTGRRVFGPRGAAALLGMKPTTLASRIKALGIR